MFWVTQIRKDQYDTLIWRPFQIRVRCLFWRVVSVRENVVSCRFMPFRQISKLSESSDTIVHHATKRLVKVVKAKAE